MLNYNRFLPALLLAIIMLVGCKEPVGLPNDKTHAASVKTAYCTVEATQNLSGYVDYYQGLNSYSRSNPTIKWGFVADVMGRPNPRSNGFCVFTVPAFESPGMVPVCSLFFYQTGHNGTADLQFKWLPGITSWPNQDSVLYKAIDTGTVIMKEYGGQSTDNSWYGAELNSAGMEAIEDIGLDGGGTLITGWKYGGSSTGTYATADGATQTNPPYIKIVCDDEP